MRLSPISVARVAGSVLCLGALAMVGCATETADSVDSVGSDLALANGFSIKNGAYLTNGARMLNGVRVLNGFSIKNGVRVLNGLGVTNAAIARNGVKAANGFVLTISTGGDMANWIAEDVANNTLLLEYVAQCALRPDQGLQFDYGGIQYQTAGVLGFGSTWISGTMTTTQQERVTGCLLARVNSAGLHVEIDLTANFAANSDGTSSERVDLQTFDPALPTSEVATFGNLFADTPVLAACVLSGASDSAPGASVPEKSELASQTRMCGGLTTTYGTPFSACGPLKVANACKQVCAFGWVGGRYIPTACGLTASALVYTSPITVRFAPSATTCTYDWQCAQPATLGVGNAVRCVASKCAIVAVSKTGL